MKNLIFALLIGSQIGWVGAETTDPDEYEPVVGGTDRAPITVNDRGMFEVQVGEQKLIFTNLKSAQETALYAAGINSAHERSKVLDQIKDDLGLGDLERMAVGRSHPSYNQVKIYRGAKTDQLFALLENEDFLNFRYRIAWIIAVVADEAAARKLADYISSPLPIKDGGSGGVDIRTREYGLLGLSLATRDQSMPWVKDFFFAYADMDQWMKSLAESNIDRRDAKSLAMTTIGTISRMAHGEPLAMLEEIRKRRLSKSPVRSLGLDSASEKPDGEVTLEYIDVMIEQAQRRQSKL